MNPLFPGIGLRKSLKHSLYLRSACFYLVRCLSFPLLCGIQSTYAYGGRASHSNICVCVSVAL